MTQDTDITKSHPSNWGNWPRREKLDWLTLTHTRKGLLQRITSRVGIERDLHNSSRLNVEELAAIALELDEVGP